MPTDRVQLYDTTLRDGSQMEGISLSVADKVRITQKLDELGVEWVEGGFPGSNPAAPDSPARPTPTSRAWSPPRPPV